MSWNVSTAKVKAADFPREVHRMELPAEHAEAGFLSAFEAGRHALMLQFYAESLGAHPETEFQGYVNGHSWSYPATATDPLREGVQVGCGLSRYLTLPAPESVVAAAEPAATPA